MNNEKLEPDPVEPTLFVESKEKITTKLVEIRETCCTVCGKYGHMATLEDQDDGSVALCKSCVKGLAMFLKVL